MEGNLLFGFDLFAIVLAIWKLITTELFPKLSERWKRAILAFLMTGVTVLIGLQTMGLIFPPESQPVVTLVLTAIMAFLATMGYSAEVIGVVNATVDLVRFAAIQKIAEPSMMAKGTEETVLKRMIRYRLHK